MPQHTEGQVSALVQPTSIRPSVSLDNEQTTRQTLIGYASTVIANSILFDKQDGRQPLADVLPEWSELDGANEQDLSVCVAGILDAFDTDTLQVIVEESMASALSVLVNKEDSGINLIIGKVAFRALSDQESETKE